MFFESNGGRTKNEATVPEIQGDPDIGMPEALAHDLGVAATYL